MVDYVLVSRRSRDRAGLRYQRRGIDDDANVANFVETETIMRVEVSVTLILRFYKLPITIFSERASRMFSVMSRSEGPVGHPSMSLSRIRC